MNSNGSSRVNPLLATKLRSLEKLDEKIADLASQIKQMQTERRNLEQEIAVMRASAAPVRRLPTEILTYIFKELLHGVRDESERLDPSRKIADLMLVCKTWHGIVSNTPTLWTKIYIKLTDDTINGENLARHLKYIQTFMANSKEMPINVSIDLSTLSFGATFVENCLKASISSLAEAGFEEYYEWGSNDEDSYDDSNFEEVVLDWFYGLSWQGCPLVEPYEKLCGRFLGSVAGENGDYMKRWKSLHLLLPFSEESAIKMLNHINFEAPLLRSLHLRSWGIPLDIWKSHSLRASANLDHICLDGDPVLSLIPESYGARRLEIISIRSLQVLNFLNHFSNLRYLRVQPIGYSRALIVRPVRLPHLQHLRIGGNIPDGFFQSFEIARLLQLSLDYNDLASLGNYPWPMANLFQAVEFVSIIMQPREWPHSLQPVPRIVSMIPGLFKQLSSTTTIGANDVLIAEVSSVIDEFKTRGELPALQSFVKVNQDGEIISGAEYATYLDSSSKS